MIHGGAGADRRQCGERGFWLPDYAVDDHCGSHKQVKRGDERIGEADGAQPGFKIDYASYLRASPRHRAWMHAAGAIATKLTPFLIIPYALAIDTDTWAVLLLAALGVIQIVTDLLFSVKASDWKKFRREMRLARARG